MGNVFDRTVTFGWRARRQFAGLAAYSNNDFRSTSQRLPKLVAYHPSVVEESSERTVGRPALHQQTVGISVVVLRLSVW